MERFWATVERTRGENCTTWIITDIAQFDHTKRIHRVLGMTPCGTSSQHQITSAQRSH
jgi:hypothetical protein